MDLKKKFLVICASVFALFMGFVSTVSAAPLGEGYALAGIPIGWGLIGLAVILGALIFFKILKKELAKKLGTLAVVLLLVGVALQFVQAPDADAASMTGVDINVTGSAVTTGDNTISTNWDEDENVWTIPLTVSDSSDGNLSDHIAILNLTLDPISQAGLTADNMQSVHFSADYNMQYGGEDIVSKSGNDYLATWTDEDGGTHYGDGVIDMQMTETKWAYLNYTFNNGTAGNWVTELSAVGDTATWYIHVWTDEGFRETITVNAVVVSYTA